MDPHPDFATSSLTFSVANLEALHTYQLALIPFMPRSEPQLIDKARQLFRDRRRDALRTKEEGLGEKLWELKRLKHLRETVAGGAQVGLGNRVKDSESVVEEMRKKMQSLEKENQVLKTELEEKNRAVAQAEEESKSRKAGKWNVWVRPDLEKVGPSTSSQRIPSAINHSDSFYEPHDLYLPMGAPNLLEAALLTQEDFEIQTPPSQSTSLPKRKPESPRYPGPFFSQIERVQSAFAPQALKNQIYSISINNLPSKLITPLLILHYLRSREFTDFPRPLAISRSQSGNIWVAFRSAELAENARKLLDGQVLPGFHEISPVCKIVVESKPGIVHPYKWHQLSDEVRESWDLSKQLPGEMGNWVSKTEAPSSLSVAIVSEDYDRERRRILGLPSVEEAEEELRQKREEDDELQLEMIIRLEWEKVERDLLAVDSVPWNKVFSALLSAMARSTSSSSRPSTSRSQLSQPTAAFSQEGFSDDEGDIVAREEDSEEDEWEQERSKPSSSSKGFEQDKEEYSESDEEDEEDGMALYESDQGEVIDEDDENEEEAINNQLASIPFTSLLKAQKQLSKSTAHASRKGKGKAKQVEAEEEEEDGAPRKGKNGKNQNRDKNGRGKGGPEGRSNKHAPTEMSTKRPVSRARQIVETTTKKARDPRFDSLSGSVNPELFQRSYSFLSGSLEKEVETLRKTAIKARKNTQLPEEEKEKIEDSLRRMENRLVERKRKEREQAALKDWKKEEKEKRQQGKGAFYLKEAEKKKLFLKAKFDELSQDKRKLSKAMDKKRRKTSQKEKKQMPRIRPGGSG
ncbi:hypothetical protein JCM3765_000339 [Sporobolomyces pararoseus]